MNYVFYWMCKLKCDCMKRKLKHVEHCHGPDSVSVEIKRLG